MYSSTPHSSTSLLSNFGVIAFVIAGLTLRLALALGPLENLDGYAIPDDAYLFLDLARSIAHGEGPLYGRECTNGFQPLFAFVLAPIFWFSDGGDAPVHAALSISCLFDALTILLLLRLVGRISENPGVTRLVLAAAWVSYPLILRNTLNGMETALAFGALTVALTAHRALLMDTRVSWSRGRAALAGATLGIAMLARVDAILFAVALWTWIGWRAVRGRLFVDRPAATLALVAAGAALAFLPWIAYSGFYTGDLYPVSGRAVRFQAEAHYAMFPELGDPTWIHLRRAGGEIYRGHFVPILTAIGLLFLAVSRRGSRRAIATRAELLAPLGLHAIGLYFAYALVIGGTWFFHRYLHPIVLPMLLGLCVIFDAVIGELGLRSRAWLTTVVCTILLIGPLWTTEFDTVAGTGRDGNFGYRAIGVWTRDRFPAGTAIGAKQSGAIGYYAAECDVVNLDGVVNRAAFEALIEHRMLGYLAAQHLDCYVMWDYGADFLRHFSAQPPRSEFVATETVPDIHSWTDPGKSPFRVFELRERAR